VTRPVSHITVRVPLKIRRRPGRKTMVSLGAGQDGCSIATKADPALVKALARAFRYQKLLDEGRYASISEMAAGERIERGYLGTLLRLTLLAPAMVEAILNGRQPEWVTLPALLEGVPVGWGEQRMVLGLLGGDLATGEHNERKLDQAFKMLTLMKATFHKAAQSNC
jgi:hypothetical protein